MKIAQIKELLDCECITGEELLDLEIDAGFGSDLMSDVLAFMKEKTMLLTGLTNPQVIRTAEMLDINAITFVRGKRPSDETIALAKKNNIVLLLTKHTLYTACGILYMNGLKGLTASRKE